MFCLIALRFQLFIFCFHGAKKDTIQYSIGKRKLMHEYFPKHSRMGTARIKLDKETDKEGKKKGVSKERSQAGTNKSSPDGLSHPNQIQ